MGNWYLLSIAVTGAIFVFANGIRNIISKGFYRQVYLQLWGVVGSPIPFIYLSLREAYERNLSVFGLV